MLTNERKHFLSKLVVDLVHETSAFYLKKFADDVLLQMQKDGCLDTSELFYITNANVFALFCGFVQHNMLFVIKAAKFNDISISEDELKEGIEDHFDRFFQMVRDSKEPLTQATLNFVKEMQKCQK